VRSSPFGRLQVRFALAAMAVYVAVSFRVGAVFPFYDFPMFSRMHESRGRTFVRDAAGREHRVVDFERWWCPSLDAAIALDRPCGLSQTWAYDELMGAGNVATYLRSHAAGEPQGEPVELLLRVWRAGQGGAAPGTTECLIMQCNARRRGDGVGR
jgi:hypothetical protein